MNEISSWFHPVLLWGGIAARCAYQILSSLESQSKQMKSNLPGHKHHSCLKKHYRNSATWKHCIAFSWPSKAPKGCFQSIASLQVQKHECSLYLPFHSPLQAQKRSDISALVLESISQFSWICFHIDSTCVSSPQEVQHHNTTTPREYGHMIMLSKPTSWHVLLPLMTCG